MPTIFNVFGGFTVPCYNKCVEVKDNGNTLNQIFINDKPVMTEEFYNGISLKLFTCYELYKLGITGLKPGELYYIECNGPQIRFCIAR